MTAAELVDHLEATHHRYLWHEMPRVSVLVDKIVSVHGGRHPELSRHRRLLCTGESRSRTSPAERRAHALPHDPRARRVHRSAVVPLRSLRNPISVMLHEHDAVGEHVRPVAAVDRRLSGTR